MLKFQPPFSEDAYYQQKAKKNAKENLKAVVVKASTTGQSRTPLVDTDFNGEHLHARDLSRESHGPPNYEVKEQSQTAARQPTAETNGNGEDGMDCTQEVFDRDLVDTFQPSCAPADEGALRRDSPDNDAGQKVRHSREGQVVSDVTSDCFENDTVPLIETPAFNKPDTPSQSSLSISDEEENDMVSDEWEGEIIEEGPDGFMIDWKPSLIPKSYASMEMIDAWELKKKAFLAKNDKYGDRSGIKRGAGSRGQIMKAAGSTGTKRKRGRPRKVQPSMAAGG